MKLIGKKYISDFLKQYIKKIPSKNSASIIKCINKAIYISFDIFDTLIKRTCGSPYILFMILADEYNKHFKYNTRLAIFAEQRIEAENRARKIGKSKGLNEISIQDIYNAFPEGYTENEKVWLLQKEIELELLFAHPNNSVVEYFNYCIDNNKMVYLISDMYLSEDVIKQILTKCGIHGYQKLYLSSSCNAQKIDGTLFKKYMREIKDRDKSCLHFGDSIKGDIIAAKKLGIKTIRIPQTPLTCRFTRNFKTSNLCRKHWKILQRIQESNIDPSWNNYYCFGFECFGPFVYGICKWLYSDLKKRNIQKISFFSRDGYIVKKAFEILYPDYVGTNYLYVSRRSVIIPQYWLMPGLEAYQKLFTANIVWTYESFSEQLGIDKNFVESAWREAGFSENDFIYNHDLLNDERIKQFFSSIQYEVTKNSKAAYALFIEYLKQESVSSKIAIFDIGWRGTIQNCIETILNTIGDDYNIIGYYVGLIHSAYQNTKVQTFYKKGYVPNVACSMMFDLFFTALEGSTKGYRRSKNGFIEPVLYDSEYNSSNEVNVISNIFEGTLAFIRTIKQFGNIINLDHTEYGVKLLNACRYPRRLELKMFADLTFTDKSTYKMACPKNIAVYIRNIGLLKRDFWESGWKIGFLKRLFKIPFPYFRLYSKLKEIMDDNKVSII